jgi:tRNA(adenine34) deaminase
MPQLDELLADPGSPFHFAQMGIALEEARQAFAEAEVPIGAVVVHPVHGVLGRGHNQRERFNDPTAHAEVLALRQAGEAFGSWRLEGCLVYATLEPCPMCAGAIVQARAAAVLYGCPDPKAGACQSLYRITEDTRLNHRCPALGGIRQEECADLLRQFFQQRRAEGKK